MIGVDLGGGTTQGVVITDGALTGLNATATLDATLGGGTLTASNVNLVYQAATGNTPAQLALSGTADLKFGSNFDLSLALGTSSSPGLLIQNGSLTTLDATASLDTTLAGATFNGQRPGCRLCGRNSVVTRLVLGLRRRHVQRPQWSRARPHSGQPTIRTGLQRWDAARASTPRPA